MAFHSRIYDLYAIWGAPHRLPWQSAVWAELGRAIAPLLDSARGKATLRTHQYGGEAPRMKPLTFGRLAANAASAAKWTHEVPGRLASGVSARFLSAELWAPSWGVCEAGNRAPDVFLAMRDARNPSGAAREPDGAACGSMLLLAVAADIGASVTGEAGEAGETGEVGEVGQVGQVGAAVAREVAELLEAVQAGHVRRPWGRGFGGGFTDAIQDLLVSGELIRTLRAAQPIRLSALSGGWVPL